jgi:hypothetical protein
MSKKQIEESKLSIEDLQKKIKDVKKLTDDSKVILEDKMKHSPLESAAMIFVVGVIVGVLIGSTTARRR